MKRLTLLLACLVVGVGLAIAQNRTVTGVVYDESGEPIVGASVIAKGSAIGTVTSLDGSFSVSVPSSITTFVVKYLGMKDKEVAISNNMRIVLSPDSELLEEVVVIGYGTQSARTLSSAISSVKADQIRDVPNVSIDQTLQGRAAGVQITTPAGIVGQPPVVRVRGVNSITSGTAPLYVVDGVPIYSGDIGRDGQANGLADINPNDILSVDILKDAAAAALYGSRAANGVMLITTKSGSRDRLKVSYDGWLGFSDPTNFADVMNAQQYVDFKNMAVKNRYGTDEMSLTTGYKSPYGNKAFNMMTDSKGNIIDSDWKDVVFQTGVSQNHTVAVSGGSSKYTFYMSGNYTEQEGMVINDTYNRLGVKANASIDATEWLKLTGNVNATSGKTAATDAARAGSNFAVGGFPRMAMINSPNIPLYNEDGSPYYAPSGGLGYGPNTVYNTFSNPAKLVEVGNIRSTEVTRIIANFAAEIEPVKRLKFKTQYGIDYTRTDDQRFWSPIHGDGYNLEGLAIGIAAKNNQWIWTNTADYAFSIGDNNFNLLAGTEANETYFSSWGIQRTELADMKYKFLQGAYLTNDAAGMLVSENSLASYLGRLNYDYAGKYLASFNFRRDGYSALGSNSRWGNFGGVSAAWRASEESFFTSINSVLSQLKIKGSWGIVGNTNIYNYASKTYYNPDYYGRNSIYWLGQIGNPNLKWETSTKYDIGFESEFFNRVKLDFDYYYTKTDDLILDVPQAPSKGLPGGILRSNAGKMENKGFEVTLSADIIKGKDFTWNSSFNITTNQNKVLALADGVNEILGRDDSGLETTNITVVGKSIGQLYVAQTRGIDPATGRRIFVTKGGEEVLMMYEKGGYYYKNDPTKRYGPSSSGISVNDYAISGNTLPTYYGGWNNTFKYKGIDATLFFQFSGGNKILNGTKATLSDMRYWNNAAEVGNKYWSAERSNATYAYPIYGDNYSNGSANPISDWIEDGDYLRLKNLVIGYTFNTSSWGKKAGISSLRIYGQAQNLLTFTNYSGLDPEALTNVQSYNLAGGTDKNTMPQSRTYTIGLNLSF